MQADLGVWDRGGVLSAQVSSLIGKGGAHVGWAGCAAHITRARYALAKSAALFRMGHIKCAPAQAKSGAPAHFNRSPLSHSLPFSALRRRIPRRNCRFFWFFRYISEVERRMCNHIAILSHRSFKARAEPPRDPIRCSEAPSGAPEPHGRWPLSIRQQPAHRRRVELTSRAAIAPQHVRERRQV